MFPRRCPVCLDIVTPWGRMVCNTCRDRIQPVGDRGCMKCGRMLLHPEEEYCSDCRQKDRSFVRGIVGFDYGEAFVREMIFQVKYHNARQLLDYPCHVMAREYHRTVESWDCQCLIPVPVHRSRRRRRGFNQAEEIARRLGQVWKLPVETRLLTRIKKTLPQKELDASSRMRNLMTAFEADAKRTAAFSRVILVDDIYTTGSTVEACTRVLHSAGICEVYAAVLSAGRNWG